MPLCNAEAGQLFDLSSCVRQILGGILAALHLLKPAGGLIRGELFVALLNVFRGVFLLDLAVDGLAGEVGAALGLWAQIAFESAAAGALGIPASASVRPTCARYAARTSAIRGDGSR